tara:strand:- start:831 stop:1130 length:300 start_codon:yes stop_codon:yes gene_type:complete
MRFFQVLKRRKILFLNIFLFLYIAMNLFTGERGLLSYYEKNQLEKSLQIKKINLENNVNEMEHKNLLLSENLNFDFIDILLREKFKVGNKDEILIKLHE